MSDNRTTELLRKLLEERGLSCQTHYMHASWRVGQKLYGAVDNLDGTLTVDNLTPEQAIAATLGNSRADYHGYEQAAIEAWESIKAWNSRAERTCCIEHVKGGAMYDVWRCSTCGYEYAESVSEKGIVQNYCPNCGRKCI